VSVVDGSTALMPEPPDEEADEARLKAIYDEEFGAFTVQSYNIAEESLRAGWRDHEAVKDALQTAYLHGRVNWPKIRSYARPIGWIITTARNRLLKEHGRCQRETAMAPEDLPAGSQPNLTDRWEAQELLRGWLQQLPPRQAEVFQMSRHGFSNDEIARTLGLADASVRHYKAAANRQLRQLAEQAGYTDSDGRRRPGGAHGSR
jgi:RNA polymerase sigma factor (sigma-70 family)